MEIVFGQVKSRKKCRELAKIYESSAKKGKDCKNRNAVIYVKIISFLSSSENFEAMMKNPLFRIYHGHLLKGDLKEKWALEMVYPERFVFEPCWPSNESKKQLDYMNVKKVSIYDIVDYH